jgi:hypothetical protein
MLITEPPVLPIALDARALGVEDSGARLGKPGEIPRGWLHRHWHGGGGFHGRLRESGSKI